MNSVVIYITSESQANLCLCIITEGEVGFDTEFTERRPTREERAMIHALPAGANRRTALLGWQIAEITKHSKFPVAWDNVGLRCIQLVIEGVVWVLDMRKIRAIPRELRRILMSYLIKKVCVGVLKDINVIWDDLRIEMNNVCDSGMMARLMLTDKYPKHGYSNLSLKTSVEDILGFAIDKDLALSDWSTNKLSDEQITYAALDAVASLELYNSLKVGLANKSNEIRKQIPEGWYTFNTKLGEPTRTTRGPEGMAVMWRPSDCTWYSGNKFVGYYP
ncbi:ribonuclease H-like domain-containing protein [Mycena leptocephala]|nr:ribonuclease H-like domain-containing protein [Mycena leptocephala]